MSRGAIAAMLDGGAISALASGLGSTLIASQIYSANDGDIPKTFDRIAESLTNQVRSGPQSIKHVGKVWRNEQYMRVDWPWLAYPVALLIAVRTNVSYRS
jgi:hypothetical protein